MKILIAHVYIRVVLLEGGTISFLFLWCGMAHREVFLAHIFVCRCRQCAKPKIKVVDIQVDIFPDMNR